jgi:AcrR family transcriptional regulator
MPRSTTPEETRRAILDAAFAIIHKNGFQSAGLADILAATRLTKGALYHHFPHKRALGYAVVDEIVKAYVEQWWLKPLAQVEDPLEGLAQVIQERLSSAIPEMLRLGCPLTNLALEMSPIDEGFRERLEAIYRLWRKGLARSLRTGQQHGKVRGDLDADEAATFIIASLQGAFAQAKVAQSLDVFQDCMGGLSHYLTSLRPRAAAPAA